jgi:signal transduction histidine kinase
MSGRPKHPLLIVDDEPEVLASLRSMFRRDYEVFATESAAEALELLERQAIHVVLSDHRMSGMTGADFLATVRERFPSVIRLMITGYADIDSVIDAINRGHVYRYISKPWDPAELQAIVRQAMDQYHLLAERRRLMRELEEANRVKTAFITIASHEFNTPLTVVLGMLQLALKQNSDPSVDAYLQRSLKAAQRLHSLLTDTFKLLQQKTYHRLLEREAVCCDRLFSDLSDELDPHLRDRNQHLQTSVEPENLTVQASPSHLRDILLNLLSNAIKFSPDGSTIVLGARAEPGRVRFEVVDEGTGIAWADQPHVFEPFFSTWDTTHHSTGAYGFRKRGMGLGLAIVKKFVEMHAGEIELDTTPGEGSRFVVTFPSDIAEAPKQS